MSELAIKTGQSTIAGEDLLTALKSKVYKTVNKQISTSELVFLAITLVFLQVMDAVLTGVGVATFGPEIEANIFIRFLIENWGIFPALLTIKSFAFIIICALCLMIRRVTWLAFAMKCVIVLYIFAAIIPWTMILTFKVS